MATVPVQKKRWTNFWLHVQEVALLL